MTRLVPARAERAAGALLCWVLAGLPVAAQPPASPDGGFLEFLGMMVENDGDFLDPLDLADPALPRDAAFDPDRQQAPAGSGTQSAAGDDRLEDDDA